MKTRHLFASLFAVLFVGLLLVALLLPAAQAQATDAVTPITLAPEVAPATPWYLSQSFLTTAFGVLAGLFGIWQAKGKSTAQKVNQSLILGIETATSIPAVQQFEKQIKETIRTKATNLGVQPILHELVKGITEPNL